MLELIFRVDLALIMQVEKENQLEQDVFQKGQNEPSPEVIWRVYPACEVDQSIVFNSITSMDRRTNGWRDQWTDGPMDKASYRVACMQLKAYSCTPNNGHFNQPEFRNNSIISVFVLGLW